MADTRTITIPTETGTSHVNVDNVLFFSRKTTAIRPRGAQLYVIGAVLAVVFGALIAGNLGFILAGILVGIVGTAYQVGSMARIGTAVEVIELQEPHSLLGTVMDNLGQLFERPSLRGFLGLGLLGGVKNTDDMDAFRDDVSDEVIGLENSFIDSSVDLVTIEGEFEDPVSRTTYMYHFVPNNIISIEEQSDITIVGIICYAAAALVGLYALVNAFNGEILTLVFGVVLGIALFVIGSFLGIRDAIRITLQSGEERYFEMSQEDIRTVISEFSSRA